MKMKMSACDVGLSENTLFQLPGSVLADVGVNKGGFRQPMIARTQSCTCSSLLPAMLLSGFRAGKFLRSLMSALYTLEYCRTIVDAAVKH